MRLFGCIQVPALINLLSSGDISDTSLHDRASEEKSKLYFYDVARSADYWQKHPELSMRFLEGPVWEEVAALYERTRTAMRPETRTHPDDPLFRIAFPTQKDQDFFHYLDRWSATPDSRKRVEDALGEKVTDPEQWALVGARILRDHLSESTMRCGHLFLIIENHSDVDYQDISINLTQTTHENPGSAELGPDAIAKRKNVDLPLKLASLARNARYALLLAAYVKDKNGMPSSYYTSVLTPRSLSWSAPTNKDMPIRAPYGATAARVQIPMGWGAQ